MTKPIKIALILAILVGTAIAFYAFYSFDELAIELKDENNEMVPDSVTICAGEVYTLSTIGRKDVTWRVGESDYRHDQGVLELHSLRLPEGDHHFTLFVKGRWRGERTVSVQECEARIDYPEKLQEKIPITFTDNTVNAVSRKWYVNELLITEDTLAKKLVYTFDQADDVMLRVEVLLADGEVKDYSRELTVMPPPKPKEVKKKPSKPKPTTVIKKEVTRKPVVELVNIPEPVIAAPKVVNGFLNKASYEFERQHTISFAERPDTSCYEFTNDRRTITLNNLKEDLCLVRIWVVPDPNVKRNKLKVMIKSTQSDHTWQEQIYTVEGGISEGRPMKVTVKTIGCAMVKGGSYIISVEPANPESRFADMDYGDGCLGEMDDDALVGDIKWRDETKILKLEFLY